MIQLKRKIKIHSINYMFLPTKQALFLLILLLHVLIIFFNNPKGVNGFRFCANNDTNLQLISNGYETLKIRIDETVPENFDVIIKLERLLSEFSKTLFKLTRKRAYLRNVTIILPRSWGTGPPDIAYRISSESADSQSMPQIWIKNTSPRGSIPQNRWQRRDPTAFIVPPYTIKATPCGYPGMYIRLSPELILFGNETEVSNLLGLPNKLLAKEWAKLRWGVYDEIPRNIARESYYRLSNRDIRPTICSAAIQGVNINISDPREECNLEEALKQGGCRFEPDREQENVSFSSLLYKANLPFIQGYCDEASGNTSLPDSHRHASSAPTVHNLHCKGQSVWSVMRNHPDFFGGQNPPTDIPQPPPINIKLTKILNEKIVLVLDVSSSMKFYGRMALMQQAVGYFIDTVPLNTWIGIVCFARMVTRKRNLTQVINDEMRQWLKKQSFCNADVGTSIGSGVLAAAQILLTSGPRNSRGKGGKMIILTDGVEHSRPKINETLSTIKNIAVTITTIAFGGKVEKDLESLAFQTNGRTFAVSSGEYGIDSELQEAFQSQLDLESGGPITIFSEEIRIASNSTANEEFFLDQSIGKNTLISIFYKQKIRAFVSLISPKGQIFINSTDSVRYSNDNNLNITYVKIIGVAESGKWVIQLRNPFRTKALVLRISVVSSQSDREPLTVSPALLCRSVDIKGDEVMVIYVYLSLGELAVLNATVGAIITRPLTIAQSAQLVDTSQLILSDNGLDPDITANDGVYSAYFVDFTSSGRYMVKAYASNDNGRAYVDENYLLGIGRYVFPVVSFNTRNLTRKTAKEKRSAERLNMDLKHYLQNFNRVTSAGGAFVVENFPDDNLICSEGYRHFQKNCYKVFTAPLSSYNKAQQICHDEGGSLAVVKSGQTFTWLTSLLGFKKGQVSMAKTWFGGLNKMLQSFQSLLIDQISSQPKRNVPDYDLDQLVSFIAQNFSDDVINNFRPNLEGMSNRDINRLLAELGIESADELVNIQEILLESSLLRRKRQVLSWEDTAPTATTSGELSGGVNSVTEEITIALSPLSDAVSLTSAGEFSDDLFYDVTLSEAKRPPKNFGPDGSGAEIPTCKWFQNGKIIASSGEVCNTAGRFLCEKKVKDRYPPSRVTDLKVEFFQENQTLKLSWSAPGNDFTEGQADQYKIRTMATDQALTLLENNFEMGEFITVDKPPVMGGAKEVLMLDLSENLECPKKAILDVIFALPSSVLSSELTSEKKSIIQFLNQLLSSFVLDKFYLQIAAFATTSSNTPIFNFDNQSNSTDLLANLQPLYGSIASRNETKNEIVSFLLANGGRNNVPNVLLVLTDNPSEWLGEVKNINTTIIIGIGNKIDKYLLWDMASKPGCDNSFVLDDIEELPNISSDVVRQLCRARGNELHAISLRALDEAGHEGAPSNVESFIVRHPPIVSECMKPIPTTAPTQLQEAGANATTIVLSIGVPLSLILIVLGSVMLFGQIKKYRKRRREKKRRKMEEERLKKILEARRKKAAGTANSNNSNNNLQKHRLNFFKFRYSSSVTPIA